MYRYLEAIFSHKFQIALPLILIPILCAFGSFLTGKSYAVNASVWVESSSLLQSATSASATYTNQSPNQKEAATLNEWLSTRSFMLELIEKAGLRQDVDEGLWPKPGFSETTLANLPFIGSLFGHEEVSAADLQQAREDRAVSALRKDIGVDITGTHVFSVGYSGADTALGVKVVGAVIDLFNQRRLSSLASERNLALSFYQSQLEEAQKRLDAASEAVTQFKLANPLATGEHYSPDLDQQLSELERQYSAELEQYNDVESHLQNAQLSSAAELQNGQSTFVVADEPTVSAIDGSSSSKKLIMFVLVGFVVGLCVGFGSVVMVALMDSSIRSSQDLRTLTNVPVLATILSVQEMPASKKKAGEISSIAGAPQSLVSFPVSDANQRVSR